ncbi:hypothetical protein Poli38472_011577 [Pythium oligandrum]|uniref:DUF202 domain-containing protein n=1 Tax=Pythium oligandrum TaxID=41045 RepID=A0A8K1FMB6_PYTOL|nr:hypothetical protein Poli38472_011577 [Pythium oligandrum]|eukprot:TMW64697.1 hypothetical protein Poli38472_011577 [Pythium oligandrum]
MILTSRATLATLVQRHGMASLQQEAVPMLRWMARSNGMTRIQQRGARATPPLRRPAQQQQHPSTTRPTVTRGGPAHPRKPTGHAAAAAAAAARAKSLRPKYPPGKPRKEVKVDSRKEELIAASERTHAADSRLGLSRNALTLRFSNENSYLNWARNGVLSSAVGVAMYAQEHHRGAQLSGAGLLLLGFGYIGVGTIKYIYYILRFRQVMELSWASVIGTTSHASAALMIWLTATASFLESVPLELDAMLLTEPLIDFLPFRIRQGLIETYSLYLDDLEHHTDEQERVLRAIRGERGLDKSTAAAAAAAAPAPSPASAPVVVVVPVPESSS